MCVCYCVHTKTFIGTFFNPFFPLSICRGIITGVYTTNSAESVQHVLESSRAQIVVVDDAKQMEKICSIRQNLPHLKTVIQTMPPYAPYVKRDDGFYRVSFSSLLTRHSEIEFPVAFFLLSHSLINVQHMYSQGRF